MFLNCKWCNCIDCDIKPCAWNMVSDGEEDRNILRPTQYCSGLGFFLSSDILGLNPVRDNCDLICKAVEILNLRMRSKGEKPVELRNPERTEYEAETPVRATAAE